MQLKASLKLTRSDFIFDVQLDFPLQGITALYGASGSGKTTLLRSIAGLEKCHGGFLQLGGEVWQSEKKFMPPHRRGSGLIFQEVDLFSHLTVRKNLNFGYKRLSESGKKFSFDQIVSLLKIIHLLDRRVTNLSGGERQLVALGRTLLRSPRLLLMDEPLAALDLTAKLALFPCLKSISSELKIPIVYVSHSIDEVARLADSLIVIERGHIVAGGEIHEMLTRLDLPLAKSAASEAIINGKIVGHDDTWHLTHIRFVGGEFRIPKMAAVPDTSIRLRIAASDVSLSLSRCEDSSILNIFPATVSEVVEEESAIALIQLDLGGSLILARITRMSCNTLGIKPGLRVFAQIKSAAVLL